MPHCRAVRGPGLRLASLSCPSARSGPVPPRRPAPRHPRPSRPLPRARPRHGRSPAPLLGACWPGTGRARQGPQGWQVLGVALRARTCPLHRRPCPSAPELPARCRRSPWARLSPRARERLVPVGHTSSAAAAASRNKRSQEQHSGPQGRLCPSETSSAKRAVAPAADPCPGSTHGRGCPGAGGG